VSENKCMLFSSDICCSRKSDSHSQWPRGVGAGG
jgi:hypothetical protein